MLSINRHTAALIIVDLQEGILSPEPTPFGKEKIVQRAKALADGFSAKNLPIVLTVTDFAKGYLDAPCGIADTPWALPPSGLPENFAKLVPDVEALPAAVCVTKRQMSAFFGTELDLQLRRRRCETVVICGVATNLGVEATARAAFDLNYNVVIASDACGSVAPSLHEFAMSNILPRISQVRTTAEILEVFNKE